VGNDRIPRPIRFHSCPIRRRLPNPTRSNGGRSGWTVHPLCENMMNRTLRPARLAARQAARSAAPPAAPARPAAARLHSAAVGARFPQSSQASYWLASSLASATLVALVLKPELNPFSQSWPDLPAGLLGPR
jgi:hypothetical protein